MIKETGLSLNEERTYKSFYTLHRIQNKTVPVWHGERLVFSLYVVSKIGNLGYLLERDLFSNVHRT